MKLRLENGNFGIKRRHDESSGTMAYDSLPKGLTIVDFIGVLVEDIDANGQITSFNTVTNALIWDTYVECTVINALGGGAIPFFYNPLNGKVGENINGIVDDDSTDEGGSDSGGDGR